MPGTNAAPMHPRCRCSVAAYEDSGEYEAWLDFLDKGGTTEEWENQKKKSITKNDGYSIKNKLDTDKQIPVHKVGKLNRDIYKCITEDIVTDEVIITNERIQHIKVRHPNDYEKYYKNSIITFMKIDEKEWSRLVRNKQILYKRE